MFYSILFPRREQHERPRRHREPHYFRNLSLDRLFESVLMEDKGFGLKEKRVSGLESFFYTPLHDQETIVYRQDVMRELEDDNLRTLFVGFTHTLNYIEGIVTMVHDSISSPLKWRDNYLVRGQLLDGTEKYSQAISSLSEALSRWSLRSAGLSSFAEYLKTYLISKDFTEMCDQAKHLREELSTVEYCMHIRFPTIRVRKYEEQPDLAKNLLAVFSKFNQGSDTQGYRLSSPNESQDFQMEATVLNMVASLYRGIFASLDKFCDKYYSFIDETMIRFTHEIQFYLLWLELIAPLKQKDLPFCYPMLHDNAEHIYSRGGFDLALACMKGNDSDKIVQNDYELRTPERIIVVTGPNQGGKTTFARAFGQMHHLASLGLSVPGSDASLYLFDNILTHFEKEEELSTLSGMLQDDLIRLRELMDKATSRSIIIINEIFGSTTLKDALILGKRMVDALAKLDAPAVVVTFLDELANHGPKTVSMMSIVDENEPDKRTFKIMRKPTDGLAFAMVLAKKHGLAYEQIIGRLGK